MNINTRVIKAIVYHLTLRQQYFKHTNKAIMSFQNNKAKEIYPYKIIQSGYAPSSPHKIFKSCTTPMTSRAIGSYFLTRFSIFTLTQYMSVSHGHSTIGGIEYDGGGYVEKKKRRKSHIDQAYQRAMEMPINRYQCE